MTNHRISVAFKLIIARFANTAIVPFLVSFYNGWEDLYDEGGLVSDIFYLLIALAFVDPILYLFNFGY